VFGVAIGTLLSIPGLAVGGGIVSFPGGGGWINQLLTPGRDGLLFWFLLAASLGCGGGVFSVMFVVALRWGAPATGVGGMASFHFDLVSPERVLFSGEVDQVDVPGVEGDFGVLAGHAPLIASVRPGILTVFRQGGQLRIVVNGGFAEVNPAGLTVLADYAVPV